MRYRVTEDLSAPADQRYAVEASPFGHVWSERARFPDFVSAEIEMEKLAAPRVLAQTEGP